MTFSYRNCK